MFWDRFWGFKRTGIKSQHDAAAQCFLKITKGIFLYRILFIMNFFIKNCSDMNMSVFPCRFKALLWPYFSPSFMCLTIFPKIQSLSNCQKPTASLLIFLSQSIETGSSAGFSFLIKNPVLPWEVRKFCVIFNFIISMHIISL